MAGIYIHIPFCRHKCNYCNFYSTPASFDAKVFASAIINEAKLRNYFLRMEKVETIYFGGGTPGLFHPDVINEIILELSNLFTFNPNIEITIEVNPDDISIEWLESLRKTQVNRISIGIQTFNNVALKYLERLHSGEHGLKAIKMIKDAGYTNISADLIYAIPGQTNEMLQSDIEVLTEMDIPHISAYNLTVEPSTRLTLQIRKGIRKAVSTDQGAQHFEIVVKALEEKGYLHYEISNFCKPGLFSKHNTSYWQGVKYLGLGPSAHSFDGGIREWNVSNVKRYVDAIKAGIILSESETLSQEDKYNEYIMTGIRTMWGCSLFYIESEYGLKFKEYCLEQAKPWIKDGSIIIQDNSLILSFQGKFLADGIASSMFFIAD
jgi:oxygen-independent coproporphyrinogen III oxidase